MQRRIVRNVEIEVLSYEDLSKEERQLCSVAEKVRLDAYAPYSKFLVGAALELSNQVILTGNNQENAAYPSGLCAERVALYFAGANYPQVAPLRLAIVASYQDAAVLEEPATPCGGCLQALQEYESRFGSKLEILLLGKTSVWKVIGMQNLLPFAFNSLEIK